MIAKQKKHALLSASSSERWLNCTPSARIESTYKDDITSPFAEEGTKAHELCETYINVRLGKTDKFIMSIANQNAPLEMQRYAEDYANYVLGIENAEIVQVENKISLDTYIPQGFGTCDAFVLTKDNHLHIIDFKYGMGVYVSAYKNTQLMIYALGIIEAYSFIGIPKSITLHIYQPRIDNISTYTLEYEELKEWGEKTLAPAAIKAYKGLGEFNQGEWCRFCKHKNNCKTRHAHFIEIIKKFK